MFWGKILILKIYALFLNDLTEVGCPKTCLSCFYGRGSQPGVTLPLGVTFAYLGVNSMMLKLQYFVFFYGAGE